MPQIDIMISATTAARFFHAAGVKESNDKNIRMECKTLPGELLEAKPPRGVDGDECEWWEVAVFFTLPEEEADTLRFFMHFAHDGSRFGLPGPDSYDWLRDSDRDPPFMLCDELQEEDGKGRKAMIELLSMQVETLDLDRIRERARR